jgi:DNA-binding NarL/FixJ family response regulator
MKKQRLDLPQSKKVLICDDGLRIRQALKALLLVREDTFNGGPPSMIKVVGEARDGHEAVQFVKDYLPEVVVIDACMPGMDGLEATRLIKKTWPQVKVVMLTMYADQRQAAIEAGADTFLLKGCLAESLFNAILS